jgi:hypothetical protein
MTSRARWRDKEMRTSRWRSSPTQSPGLRWLQIDVQDAYRIRSGRSTYARKEHRINFPMTLVPGPNKI